MKAIRTMLLIYSPICIHYVALSVLERIKFESFKECSLFTYGFPKYTTLKIFGMVRGNNKGQEYLKFGCTSKERKKIFK